MDRCSINQSYRRIDEKIEELLQRDKPVIIAIDGMCGSGKSFLADRLKASYECNVFHMDDFFLPLEMKTEERLSQPGGNVHYERFSEEVLSSLLKNEKVTYRPYICGLWRLGEVRSLEPKKLNIIEGTYSLHPTLRDAYDLKVFLTVADQLQLERIMRRSGEEKLQQFINRWIPLENLYFNHMKIHEIADITLDTTDD